VVWDTPGRAERPKPALEPPECPKTGRPWTREDAAMSRSGVICAVCQRSRTRGDHAGDVFICAECQDDAKQLIDIQDSIWVEANEAGDATGDTDK
jgi:hypothetical protein